jgi:hypothetical protein
MNPRHHERGCRRAGRVEPQPTSQGEELQTSQQSRRQDRRRRHSERRLCAQYMYSYVLQHQLRSAKTAPQQQVAVTPPERQLRVLPGARAFAPVRVPRRSCVGVFPPPSAATRTRHRCRSAKPRRLLFGPCRPGGRFLPGQLRPEPARVVRVAKKTTQKLRPKSAAAREPQPAPRRCDGSCARCEYARSGRRSSRSSWSTRRTRRASRPCGSCGARPRCIFARMPCYRRHTRRASRPCVFCGAWPGGCCSRNSWNTRRTRRASRPCVSCGARPNRAFARMPCYRSRTRRASRPCVSCGA